MTEKQKLRKQYLQLRSNLNDDLLRKNEDRVLEVLKSSDIQLNGKKVACYMSVKNEMGTKKLIKLLIAEGNKVFLPKMITYKKKLTFFEVKSFNDLSRNEIGILEPKESGKIGPTELDYIFMPCVCFDEKGFRVGMGQGYYDHSLDSIDQSQTKLIILAHEIQKTESCYPEKHDIKADFCLTDRQAYRFD